MDRLIAVGLLLAAFCLAGCSEPPTKEKFSSRELKCLQCYCRSNAVSAEAALLECARYADACQKAGVKGIQYNEVSARIYGRLYLVEQHLGHSMAAEQFLQKYAKFRADSARVAGNAGLLRPEVERMIERELDHGLRTVWQSQ
jgi:hypothetical protein